MLGRNKDPPSNRVQPGDGTTSDHPSLALAGWHVATRTLVEIMMVMLEPRVIVVGHVRKARQSQRDDVLASPRNRSTTGHLGEPARNDRNCCVRPEQTRMDL